MIESLFTATNSTLPVAVANVFSGDGTNFLLPFTGSATVGFFMSYALKRILRWAFIVLGVLAGAIFLVIQYLHVHGYIGSVDWVKLGNHLSAHIQALAAQIDITNVHGLLGSLGLPLSGGFGVGALAGLIKR